VDLLELGVFGGENLEWSCFFGSGAAWSSPKHALNLTRAAEKPVPIFCDLPDSEPSLGDTVH
jgi:hypothetical protein